MSGLHTLSRTTKRAYRRVGRGQGSKRGKTSGRGTKGQNARAGRKKRPELRDLIKKIPKRRGYGKNRGRTVVNRPDAIVISLERVNALFETGTEISKRSLAEKGLVTEKHANKFPVKIVGNDSVTKKFSVKGVALTAAARASIEKAGGTIA